MIAFYFCSFFFVLIFHIEISICIQINSRVYSQPTSESDYSADDDIGYSHSTRHYFPEQLLHTNSTSNSISRCVILTTLLFP